jgi:hypothetical protein
MQVMKKTERESYIENDYVEFWIEEGVIFEVFKPQVHNINLAIAKEVVRDRLKVSNGIVRPLLIDSSNSISMDKEARDYFVSEESILYLNVSAIVVHNTVSLFVGRLFLAFSNPNLKVELFKNRVRALNYLKSFVNENTH